MISVRHALLGGVAKVAAGSGRQDARDYAAEQKARLEEIRRTGVGAPVQDVEPVNQAAAPTNIGKSVRTSRKGPRAITAASDQQTAVAAQPQSAQTTQGRAAAAAPAGRLDGAAWIANQNRMIDEIGARAAAAQPQSAQTTQGRAPVPPRAAARPADVTVRSGQGYGSTGAKITGGKGIAGGMVNGQTSLATALMRAQVASARGGNSMLHAGMKFNDFAGIPIYAGMTKSTPSGVKPKVNPAPAPAKGTASPTNNATAATVSPRPTAAPTPGGAAPVSLPPVPNSPTGGVSTPTAPGPIVNQPGAKPPVLAVPAPPNTPSAATRRPGQ